MKFSFLKYLLYSIMAIFLSSCNENGGIADGDDGGEQEPEVRDEYNYLALRSDGLLLSIGDTSGKVTNMGQLTQENFNIILNAVTSSQTHTYIYGIRFDPLEGAIFKFDKNLEQSEKFILNFPEAFGNNPGLMSLDWDESNQQLIAVVKAEFDIDGANLPCKIARIDPETFEVIAVEDLDLNEQQYKTIYSSQLINQKLYVSASKSNSIINTDLLEVDLIDKSFVTLPKDDIETGIINLGWKPGSQQLFGFTPLTNTSYIAAVRPYFYNLDDKNAEAIYIEGNISAINLVSRTFYNSKAGEFVGFAARDGFNLFFFDPGTNNFSLTPIIDEDDLSSGIGIIGMKKAQ